MSSKIFREKMIQKGAEASLFLGQWFDKDVIFKSRIPKKYRLEELDKRIRSERTINEAKALIKVKEYGLRVPIIYEINPETATIVMQFIKGYKLKVILETLDDAKRDLYFEKLGHYIARLHVNGHIHGDITTSNIIITPSEELYLIDFGLHEYSDSIEDKSVDLHLLKRVLVSSHGAHSQKCFEAFLRGYSAEYKYKNSSDADLIIKNIAVIETRGRYVKKENRK